jgi:hypothetical protein
MVLPRWLFVLVAFWVMAFGVFRLYLAVTRSRRRTTDAGEAADARPDFMRRGLYAGSARRQALYGVVYLALGGYLMSTAFGFGWTLDGGCRRPSEPAPDSINAGPPAPP